MLRRICRRLLKVEALAPLTSQTRSAIIVRRKYKQPVMPAHWTQEQINERMSRNEHATKYYVDEFQQPEEEVKLILTETTHGFGDRGQVTTLPGWFARKNLLLAGLAVYATDDNVKAFGDDLIPEEELRKSTPSAQAAAWQLGALTVAVRLHRTSPWTMQPWHVSAALRHQEWVVPPAAIQIPGEPIHGPEPHMHQKEFYVIVTLNGTETTRVRCNLYLFSDDAHENEKSPGWQHQFREPLRETDRAVLDEIPRKFGNRAKEMKHMQEHLQQYKAWRKSRAGKMYSIGRGYDEDLDEADRPRPAPQRDKKKAYTWAEKSIRVKKGFRLERPRVGSTYLEQL